VSEFQPTKRERVKEDLERMNFEANRKSIYDLHKIPKCMQGNISELAWSEGHAYGYPEVLDWVQTICETIGEPLQQHIKEVREGRA
jgi:hypothetical protein